MWNHYGNYSQFINVPYQYPLQDNYHFVSAYPMLVNFEAQSSLWKENEFKMRMNE